MVTIKKISSYIDTRRRKIIYVSILNVIILMFGNYLWNNQPLYTGEDITEFSHIQWFWEVLGGRTIDEELDSALFINVSYDKQLVEHRDTIGETLGMTDVTDRSKLLELLKKAEAADNYKYLILDVRFEDCNYQSSDDTIFNQIKKMNRVVVATHKDITTPEGFPSSKAALADYYSTITTTNFERYEYLHSGQPSVPLYAFEEMTGKRMNQKLCFVTSDGKLCQKSLFLKFPSVHFEKVMANGDQRYYELGRDILGDLSEDFEDMSNNKVIVIGNFVEDLHDTYIGMKPGPYILYKALRALEKGEHYVNWWHQLLWACVYFFISCAIFKRRSISSTIPFIKKSKSRFLRFCLTFFGCTMLITLLDIILFFDGHIHSILLPSLYFTLLKYILTYRRIKV